jgi:regulator of extracellular matrix RemA (YlzA/DUF370 family)
VGTSDIEASIASDAAGQQTPVLERLLGLSLRKIAATQGPATARTVSAEIQRLRATAREAAALGDSTLARRARTALHVRIASVIVRANGNEIVERVLSNANDRVNALEKRVVTATTNGRETAGPTAHVARLRNALTEARAALAAGQPVQALLGALRVVDALEGLGPETTSAGR